MERKSSFNTGAYVMYYSIIVLLFICIFKLSIYNFWRLRLYLLYLLFILNRNILACKGCWMSESTRLLDLKILVMFLALNHTFSSIPCVFKCRCHYYSGIVRPTDQEMIGNEKSVCYGSQEEAPHGKHQGQLEDRTNGVQSLVRGFFCVCDLNGKARQTRVSRFRISYLE